MIVSYVCRSHSVSGSRGPMLEFFLRSSKLACPPKLRKSVSLRIVVLTSQVLRSDRAQVSLPKPRCSRNVLVSCPAYCDRIGATLAGRERALGDQRLADSRT